jgi:hypothetical protein
LDDVTSKLGKKMGAKTAACLATDKVIADDLAFIRVRSARAFHVVAVPDLLYATRRRSLL